MSAHPFAIKGIDSTGYMVRDAERAIGFYRDVLGLEPTHVFPHHKGAEYELADGSTFSLVAADDENLPFQPGNGILFAVDDFDATVGALEAREVSIDMQVETSVCFMALVTDTEGNTVVLHKRKAQPPAR